MWISQKKKSHRILPVNKKIQPHRCPLWSFFISRQGKIRVRILLYGLLRHLFCKMDCKHFVNIIDIQPEMFIFSLRPPFYFHQYFKLTVCCIFYTYFLWPSSGFLRRRSFFTAPLAGRITDLTAVFCTVFELAGRNAGPKPCPTSSCGITEPSGLCTR